MAALSTYRTLLRAMQVAFQGDTVLLHAARAQARETFDNNRFLSQSEVEPRLQHAREVAEVLRKNVVQGRPVEGEEGRYKLNLHPEIERGDNSTVKQAAQSLSSSKPGKCCQD